MDQDYVVYSNLRTNFESDEMLLLFDELHFGHIPKLQKGAELWVEYYPEDGISGFARAKLHGLKVENKKARILYSCERCYLYNKGIDLSSGERLDSLYVVNNTQRFLELVGEEPKHHYIGF